MQYTHANRSAASAGTTWWILFLKCVFHEVRVALGSPVTEIGFDDVYAFTSISAILTLKAVSLL